MTPKRGYFREHKNHSDQIARHPKRGCSTFLFCRHKIRTPHHSKETSVNRGRPRRDTVNNPYDDVHIRLTQEAKQKLDSDRQENPSIAPGIIASNRILGRYNNSLEDLRELYDMEDVITSINQSRFICILDDIEEIDVHTIEDSKFYVIKDDLMAEIKLCGTPTTIYGDDEYSTCFMRGILDDCNINQSISPFNADYPNFWISRDQKTSELHLFYTFNIIGYSPTYIIEQHICTFFDVYSQIQS